MPNIQLYKGKKELDAVVKPFTMTYDPKRNILFRYLVTYLIIITVLFAVIGSLSYSNIVRSWQEKVVIEMEHTVDTVIGVMEANLQNILNIQATFYTNSGISRLRKLRAGFETKEYMGFLDMSNVLNRYTSTSMFLDRLTLYFHFNHLFIASDMLDSRPEVFYKLKFPDEKISYTQWRSIQMQQKSGIFFVTKDSVNGYVDLYYRLPFMDITKGATVVAGLRVGDLIDSLGISDIYNDSAMVLMDNEENILFASQDMAMDLMKLTSTSSGSKTVSLGNTDYEWCSQKLSLLGWKVFYFASTDDLYADRREVQQNLLGIYLLMLLASVFLAFVFSKSISDPVVSLLNVVGGWESKNNANLTIKGRDGLQYVLGKVTDMKKDYSQLAARIQEYRDSSREIIYSRLLKGEVMQEDEMRMMEGETSILDYSYYTAAAARIMAFDSDGVDMAMFTVSEVFSGMRETGIFFCKTAFDRFVIIMGFELMPCKADLEEIITNLFSEIHTDSSLTIRWGIGDTVMDHDQVFITYRNAEYILYNMGLEGDKIGWYDSSTRKKNRLSYSWDDTQRLYNIISSGDAGTAMQTVKDLAERNREVLAASKTQRDRFIFVLSETVFLLEAKFVDLNCEQVKQIELHIRNMTGANDIGDIMQNMSVIINIYCSSVGLRNDYKYQRLNEKIIAYIEENYNDPNLGLASIASSLCLTESYISSFFKQSSGTNVHRYIEQKRMSSAAEMLKDTDFSTAEIVDKVGYNNKNTFYKAFKRYYGITPKEYKEEAKLKSLEQSSNLTFTSFPDPILKD